MLQCSRVLILCLAVALAHAPSSRADEKTAAPAEKKAEAAPAAAPTEGPIGFPPGKEPTKFNNIPFRASLDEVKKLYPKMEPTEQIKIAQIFSHPNLERFTIGAQKIEGLEKPCEVELRFWKKEFWLAVVQFGDNSTEAVEKFAIASFGPPNHRSPQYLTWVGPKGAVTVDLKARWYEVHDETISNEVRQAWVSGALRQQPAGKATPGEAAGKPAAAAATPPAAATPAK